MMAAPDGHHLVALQAEVHQQAVALGILHVLVGVGLVAQALLHLGIHVVGGQHGGLRGRRRARGAALGAANTGRYRLTSSAGMGAGAAAGFCGWYRAGALARGACAAVPAQAASASRQGGKSILGSSRFIGFSNQGQAIG